MKKQRTRLVSALSWAMSANFIVNSTNVLGILVFARLLGVEVIAQYGLLVVSIELLNLSLNFGFNQAAIRYKGDQKIYSAALSLIIVQSIGLVGLFLLFKSLAAWANIHSVTFGIGGVLMLFIRIVGNFVTLLYAPLESDLQYVPIARSKVIATVSAVTCGLVVAVTREPSMYALILRDLLSALLMFILMHKHCTMRFRPTWDTARLRQVWTFTMPIWFLNVLERATLRADYALAAIALDHFSFGIYFQIRALMEGVLGFLVNPIQTVVYAFYCGATDALTIFREIVVRWIGLVALVVILVSSIFFITDIGNLLVGFVLGPEWSIGGVLLGGFTIYGGSMIIFEHSKVVALAAGIQRAAVFARIMQLLTIMVAVVPMISIYGLRGAGIASGMAALILVFIANGLMMNKAKMNKAQ